MRLKFSIFAISGLCLLVLLGVVIWGLRSAISQNLVDDYLTVKKNTKARTLTFTGDIAGFPDAPSQGEIFYNSALKRVYYYDGAWRNFGLPSTTVASRVVAASDSKDASRADYICSGSNDQLVIQYALDDLWNPANPSKPMGGVVYLLEGTYKISGSINLNNNMPSDGSMKAIIGAGSGTLLKVAAGSADVFYVRDVKGALITHLAIDGSGVGSTAITFEGVTDSKVDKVWVRSMSGHGFLLKSSGSNPCARNVITRSNFSQNSQAGLYLDNAANNNISGNTVGNNSNPAYGGIHLVNSSNNNIISENKVVGNLGYGIVLDNAGSNTVSNNILNANAKESIYLNNSLFNLVLSNIVAGGTGGTITGGVKLNISSYNLISANNISYPVSQTVRGHGVSLYSSSYNSLAANSIYDESADVSSSCGIYLDGTSSYNLIATNNIYDSATASTRYGINISLSTCVNNYIGPNVVSGAGYLSGSTVDRRIKDTGVSSRYTHASRMSIEPPSAVLSVTGGSTIPVTGSYIKVTGSFGSVTASLSDGKAAGQILILEGTSANTVTINDVGNVDLSANHALGQNNILRLIWNGKRWLELDYK